MAKVGRRKESWLTFIIKDPFERERGGGGREGKAVCVHSSPGFPCTAVLCQSAVALVLGSQGSACKGAELAWREHSEPPGLGGGLRRDAGAV